jgi:hypothetical protein
MHKVKSDDEANIVSICEDSDEYLNTYSERISHSENVSSEIDYCVELNEESSASDK